jgi:hypothetical protein
MAKVKIIVSGVPIGQSFIVPYSHKDGLQHYPAGHVKAKQPVIIQSQNMKSRWSGVTSTTLFG